jgi:Putative beta-lactamase-inhibitor-like, PepSY-like
VAVTLPESKKKEDIMPRFISWLPALPLAAMILLAAGRADEKKVALDKVPKAVLDALKAKFPDAKLVAAVEEMEEGKTVYEIAITSKKQKMDVTLTADGKIVEIEKEISAKDLPQAVAEGLETKYPKATHKKIEEVIKVKDGEEKLEYYEVLLTTVQKKTVEIEIAPDGKILKVEEKNKKKEK